MINIQEISGEKTNKSVDSVLVYNVYNHVKYIYIYIILCFIEAVVPTKITGEFVNMIKYTEKNFTIIIPFQFSEECWTSDVESVSCVSIW